MKYPLDAQSLNLFASVLVCATRPEDHVTTTLS